MKLLFQIELAALLQGVNLKVYPDLVLLKNDNETLEDFIKLSPEKILIRWFNHHLKRAGHQSMITHVPDDLIVGTSD